jgi:hypothetical protein
MLRRLFLGAFILVAAFSAPVETKAQAPGTCALAPSFCQLQGKTLDTRRCRCVRPRPVGGGFCALAPFFCELNGKELDAVRCVCVPVGTPVRPLVR